MAVHIAAGDGNGDADDEMLYGIENSIRFAAYFFVFFFLIFHFFYFVCAPESALVPIHS